VQVTLYQVPGDLEGSIMVRKEVRVMKDLLEHEVKSIIGEIEETDEFTYSAFGCEGAPAA
jgi:hypothetical protein